MKVIAEVILHYGKETLEYALKSLEPFADKIVILYSKYPSQGFSSPTAVNPDTREELFAIAKKFPKTEWVDCQPMGSEGEHRGRIFEYTKEYDVCMLCDADEVYEPNDLGRVLHEVFIGDKRYYNVDGFIHFWKTKEWCCTDSFRPTRFIRLAANDNSYGEVKCRIYHFSCAQDIKTIQYKWTVSGHHDELRKDWFQIFNDWSPENQIKDVHPTSFGVWPAVQKFTGILPYGL